MSPDQPADFAIKLSADAGCELFVVDSRMRLVQRGVGTLDTRLPAGVYKVKVRRGREENEQIILLDHDQEIPLKAPAIVSPAPFEGTARTHEWHVSAAEQESGHVHVTAGSGAQVFLMSRYWTAADRQQQAPPEHPGRGLTLRTMSGRVVVDYERDAVVVNYGRDPLAACTVALDPGTYLLHRQTGNGPALEQAIIASPDWQTQVFVLKDPVLGLSEPVGGDLDLEQQRALRPDALSVLMSRGAFDSKSTDMETTEVAQLALADERRILSEQLSQMLDGKFENPMLGIYGAHLLLLAVTRASPARRKAAPDQVPLDLEVDPAFLDVIVRNLRGLVGSNHPDVEAISTRCVDPALRTQQPLPAPPMLRRSWSLFVAASNERPDLIPDQIWTRVRQLVTAPPFFTWARMPSRIDPAVSIARSVTKRQARTVVDRQRIVAASMDVAASMGTDATGSRRVTRGGGLRSMNLGPRAALPSSIPAASQEPDLRQMSIDHDIPRGVIDKAFGKH